MGISRDSRHKRSHTGAKRAFYRKKRKFELGRQPANTKLGAKRIHSVRCRGGNTKYRAMRLEAGNYSWGSESVTRKTRIVSVVYNASNNELVRTNTLVKGAIVQIDGTPFRQWYESHYALPLGRKKKTESATPAKEANPNDPMNKPRSKSVQQKIHKRQANAAVDSHLEDQFSTGRLFAMITSRPGQCGRADGYILEGKELEFYMKKIKGKK
ncbi:ribosomal protein S8A [Dispira simplex]|nr:ribosomal protein S8A [Dispira simplex]